MNERPYLLVSGTIFGLVACVHLVRAAAGSSLTVGAWEVPGWISLVAALVGGALAIWALRLARRPRGGVDPTAE